ncbi:MAG: UbiA family prenyltransferase [Phycisphaerales bacterium]|nr:UbiA family prenyltransferase [Phycisphaerales bacterium]
MRRTLAKLAPILHLTRVTTAFAAIANVWFVVLWTQASAKEIGTPAMSDHPTWILLLGGAANALGLFAFAAALNDVLDLRRDRTLNPERPIASGRITLDAAVSLVVGTLMVAVLGAAVLGVQAVLLTLLVGGAILFFNAAGKFVPAVGLVALGLIYAGQMVVPNPQLVFVWPVWLVMTHSLAVAAVVHILKRKVPTLSRRAMGFAVFGWLFWTVIILVSGWARSRGEGGLWPGWVSPWSALGPALLAAVFVLMSYRKVRLYGPGPRAANKIARYGALWLALYACAWLIGQSIWAEEGSYARAAWILTALSAAGFIGMTVLREAYALLEHPLGYRR